MVLTVGDIERIKAALESKNMTVSMLLMLIKGQLVCDECEYKKQYVESLTEVEDVSLREVPTD